MEMQRRDFLKGLAGLSVAPLCGSTLLAQDGKVRPIRFGVIADVHQDIMHDAEERLQVFVDAMREADVDFILQIGDFCVPKEANRNFLNIFKSFPGPQYHVIGNHDTDGGYRREQTVEYYGMPDRFYSWDQQGFHFVVLDGNDRPADHQGGYPRYMAQDQLEWLKQDIESTCKPTLVFSHQSLERENQGGVQNGADVRAILEAENERVGFKKVLACFSGHHHRDYLRTIEGIHYPQINSASYYWVGGSFQKIRYSEEIDRKHPYIKYTVPYKDPVFALVTVDLEQKELRIEGRRSEFVGPAPWELGEDKDYWDAATLTPYVSDRGVVF